MNTYLSNLVKRLKAYSLKMDKLENLVDIPWVHINEDGVREKYIFRRGGELLISRKGDVQMGNWEYIAAAGSLLIMTDCQKKLYNQGFLSHGVLLLQPDGLPDQHFALANEHVVHDLNIEKHLQDIYYTAKDIRILELDEGISAEVHGVFFKGVKITFDGETPPNGKYRSKDKKRFYELKNGYFTQTYYFAEVKSKQQTLLIEHSKSHGIFIGSRVNINGKPAPDGEYRISWFTKLRVKGGIVVKK